METFKRNDYSLLCVAGLKCLATIMVKPGDQKIVEDLHQHVRAMQRKCRTLVTSPLARNLLLITWNSLALCI